MARYRSKDETDMQWNDIRRRLTRALDTEIAKWREHALDKLLTEAWEKFSATLSAPEKEELEAHYSSWVEEALSESIEMPNPADAEAALA